MLERVKERLRGIFTQKAREIRFTDIAAYIERSHRVENQRAAIAALYEVRRQLVRNRIQELYGEKLEEEIKRVEAPGSEDVYISYDPVLERYGYDYRILSESQKRYLAQIQHQVIMTWIFPKLGALDDPKTRKIIEDYFRIYKNTHLLGERALDDWLELQEQILAIGWTKQEAQLPPVFLVQLPITVPPEPMASDIANAIVNYIRPYLRSLMEVDYDEE